MSRPLIPDVFSVLARLRPLLDIIFMLLGAVAASVTLSVFRGEYFFSYMEMPSHRAAILITLCLLPLVLSQYGAYRSQRDVPPALELVRLWSAVGFVAVLLVALGAVSKTTQQVSRLWAVLWLGYVLLSLSGLRLAVRGALQRIRRAGYDQKSIILVGGGELAARVIMHLALSNVSGYRLAGYLADVPSEQREFAGLPYLGRARDARQLCLSQHLAADQIWIAISEARQEELRQALDLLSELPHEIRVIPDGLLATLCELPTRTIADLVTVELTKARISGAGRLVKALEDRILGVLALILIFPVMLVIAMLVQLDSPGPILFRQKRHGWNGQEIVVLKFRTMFQHQEPAGAVIQARRADPRITRAGRWLRRSSLDELPQIFNVLGGSMSLVGPRPHASEHNELYTNIIQNYMHRHRVKPGITGWAQVNGYRGETDTPEKMQRRVEYDLYYIENWSLGFDLVILILTLVRGIFSPQAY
ncbi:MAG: undecaprenyl-phosphate glucose phosphotransferase [Stenotrophobium sp.]